MRLPNGDAQYLELATRINELINQDFSGLVTILYRLDVGEEKVKQALRDQPGTDAGLLIARLVIERLLEKASARQQFQPKSGIPDDEKW